MAGWYIRRGEKIVGPVELPKLQELVAAGRLLLTDELAKDVAGPWKEAGRTTLFAPPKQFTATTSTAEQPPPPASLVPKQEAPLPAIVDEPESSGKVLQAVHIVFGSIGRGMLATWDAISRTMATRAQRTHELKLAKIHAEALKAQRSPMPQSRSAAPPQQAAPPQAVYIPQVHQTTVVHVVNKNTQSVYGCSGCGVILLLILIGLFVLIVASTPTTP
jgi:hypothetical protein